MKSITHIRLSKIKKFKSGKVRDIFDLGDSLLLVATDRISAFDCVLPTGIPDKGKVLNQLSAWWFKQTEKIIPNHMISYDVKDFPESCKADHDQLKGRSMIVKKANPLPVECVVRGYLIGSGWKEYTQGGAVSGITLRPGYKMADRLDTPIFTPARKAETGHDENISFAQTEAMIGPELAKQVRDVSLALYQFACDHARQCGIIIADTKFEFGIYEGKLILIDEALTPDSSRFWPASSYAPGQSPQSFDKQFVRDYLETLAWDKKPPAPSLPEEIVQKTREKYLEAYKLLTGRDLDL
jgi:phosphoribosylaminoimidazole-succinocarboxamide synthase